jgi:prophage regulatory protein
MRFLRLPDVQSKVGLGKTEIYARIKSGEFPVPVKIGTASRWVEDELDAWMTRVVEQSRKGATAP